MYKSVAVFSLTGLLAVVLVACSGTQMATQPTPGSNVSNVSLSIGDAPPTGVTILRFEIQLTSASLQPSDTTQQAVSLLKHPEEVELEHLQSEPAFLANLNVPAGTYTGLTAAFASPTMTILNQTGSTLTVGSQTCASGQVCNLTPALNSMTVTVQQPTAPFPLTLSASSPVAFLLHFDINNSVQNDLSVSPAISLKQLPSMSTGEFESFHVVGTVGAITSPDFTLQTAFGNQTLNIATDSSTQYNFGTSCQANDFTCIAAGQLLRVKVSLMSGGILLAKEVTLFSAQNIPTFQGVVTSANSSQNQIQVVLFYMDDEEHKFGGMSPGIGITVQPDASATFSVDSDGITLPSGLGFASIQDVTVGQVLRFQPTLPITTGSGTMGQFTIGASSVTLEPSEITGNVSAVDGSATPPNFTLINLPPLFAKSSVTQMEVDPVMGTNFRNISGLSALHVNDSVSVGGLLFNTASGPVVVAERIYDRTVGDD